MKQANRFTYIGIVGLVIHLAVNLIAIFVFKKASAEFFSEDWWSSWFPSFIVWLVFLVVGLGSRGGKSDGE